MQEANRYYKSVGVLTVIDIQHYAAMMRQDAWRFRLIRDIATLTVSKKEPGPQAIRTAKSHMFGRGITMGKGLLLRMAVHCLFFPFSLPLPGAFRTTYHGFDYYISDFSFSGHDIHSQSIPQGGRGYRSRL